MLGKPGRFTGVKLLFQRTTGAIEFPYYIIGILPTKATWLRSTGSFRN
jgi:hypothetical protein